MSNHSMAAREVFYETWGFMPPWRCYFCGRPVEQRRGLTPWALNVHHLDGAKENNEPDNLVPSHKHCHMDFHIHPYTLHPFNDERYELVEIPDGIDASPWTSPNNE